MKNSFFTASMFFLLTIITHAQEKNLAERLGHPADAKMLIIHADDLGVAHSQNSASIEALEESPVNSASIIVPCPWFPEIAAYAKENKKLDFGVHLTLNSEWNDYRWGPVTPKDSVASLVDTAGYLYALVPGVVENAIPEEVEIELRNQVQRAYDYDIDVTHLDAHMGAAMATPEFLASYIKIGKENGLPVLLDKQIPALHDESIEKMLTSKDIIIDRAYSAGPNDFEKGMAQYYTEVLTTLKPGLNCLLIHLAYDDAEMKGVTVGHKNWGAKWRQADFDFFTGDTCQQLLKVNNIILVSWRELRDVIVRGE